ncbi:MAG: lipid A biosynthesis protein [Proteobacteria bacterium]|nr:lipid A biosynthesis protein [Pseudomonadota bacterium]
MTARLFKFLLKSLAYLPLPILHGLSGPLYLLLFYILRFRRKVAENNIRNSFPELDATERMALLKNHYRRLCDVALETTRSLAMAPTALERHVSFTNLGVIQQALQQNQTVLLAMAHHCNPVWAVLAAGQKLGTPVDGIYKPPHLAWLDELTLKSLSRFNITPVPAKTCVSTLLQRSASTRAVAIVADQAPRRSDKAYWTRFMHQDTPFYLGLEKIAQLFKYPIFFMDIKRTGRGHYEASFKPLAEPPYDKHSHAISESFARAVEQQILRSPQDWLWTHRRWKRAKSLYD